MYCFLLMFFFCLKKKQEGKKKGNLKIYLLLKHEQYTIYFFNSMTKHLCSVVTIKYYSGHTAHRKTNLPFQHSVSSNSSVCWCLRTT